MLRRVQKRPDAHRTNPKKCHRTRHELRARPLRSTQNVLKDGRLELDNNLIENKIRPLALGRKNYLFAGSDQGAQRLAMFYSFFGSCKALGVNPYRWLKKVLEVMSRTRPSRYADLLPGNLDLEQ